MEREITVDNGGIRWVKVYALKFLYSFALENIKEMSGFLNTCGISKLSQDEVNNLCEPTTTNIDSVI